MFIIIEYDKPWITWKCQNINFAVEKQEIAKVINRRLRFLDPALRHMYIVNPRHDRQAILLYSFLKSYRLPREFVLEILRHNLLNYRNRVSPGEVAGFFEHKAEL